MVVLDPGNAALAAAKILGISDAAVRDAVGSKQRANAALVVESDPGRG